MPEHAKASLATQASGRTLPWPELGCCVSIAIAGWRPNLCPAVAASVAVSP